MTWAKLPSIPSMSMYDPEDDDIFGPVTTPRRCDQCRNQTTCRVPAGRRWTGIQFTVESSEPSIYTSIFSVVGPSVPIMDTRSPLKS